ncbi:helix-turn-helix domain-containing protein [Paenibacillus sp. DMB20]|uniref:helix-turn-helix domain-containing protein n=1 Tax=Paenibacillus sp. DMB20 TaxID=1642570 RepID=UPI000627B666|nr:helix-turn-helix domain-containing protein [Paenibacillus sp. DMB20]KKO55004.1 AraC family transcriptional regulator [Paenibacillus sp. DMB20]
MGEPISCAKNANSNRMSVFVTLLLSYIVVLLIPVAVFGGLYTQIEKIMIENANTSNMALIEQARQVVDGRLDEMHLISRNTTSHPKLDSLLKLDPPQNGTEQYNFFSFMQELQRYRNSSGFITDFYVYLRKSDTILSPSLKTSSSVLFSEIYGYNHMTYEQFRSRILHGVHFNGFLPVTEVGKGLNQKRMLTYLQTLPFGEKKNSKGLLVMLIDEQKIVGLLEEIVKANHGTIYIKDASGQVILSVGDGANQVEKNKGGSDMMTVTTKSARNGWEYVSVVPEEVFMGKVNMVKTMAAGLLGICFAAGIGACAFMTYRAYHPLREIIRFIRQSHPVREGDVRNEYDFIKKAMAASFGKQTEMEEQLYQQTPVIRSNFMLRLLKGHVDIGDVSEHALGFMGISFPHPHFAVALIELRDASSFIHNDRESEWALIRFVTAKVAEEIPCYTSYAVELEKNLVALILNIPQNGDRGEELLQWAEQVKRVIEQRFKTLTTIGISGVHTGLGSISTGYGESVKALEYSTFTVYKPVLLYEEMKRKTEVYYDFPIEAEVQLINAIKTGDMVKTESIIRSLYENNFKGKSITPGLGKLLFANLLSTLFKLLNALNLKYEELFGTTSSPVENFTEAGSVEEMYKEILSMFETVCLHVKEQRGDASNQLLEKIKMHLREHYDDSMISLASIADRFNITPPYLSAFFKKNSGTNLTDYLAQIRIERSKEMMRDPGNTISHIARSVGYTSDIGFIRVFKKHEGITPGKYKDSLHSVSSVVRNDHANS